MDRARTFADNSPAAIHDESTCLPLREENGARERSARCSRLKSRGLLCLFPASPLQAYSRRRPPQRSRTAQRTAVLSAIGVAIFTDHCVHANFLSLSKFARRPSCAQ